MGARVWPWAAGADLVRSHTDTSRTRGIAACTCVALMWWNEERSRDVWGTVPGCSREAYNDSIEAKQASIACISSMDGCLDSLMHERVPGNAVDPEKVVGR